MKYDRILSFALQAGIMTICAIYIVTICRGVAERVEADLIQSIARSEAREAVREATREEAPFLELTWKGDV